MINNVCMRSEIIMLTYLMNYASTLQLLPAGFVLICWIMLLTTSEVEG